VADEAKAEPALSTLAPSLVVSKAGNKCGTVEAESRMEVRARISPAAIIIRAEGNKRSPYCKHTMLEFILSTILIELVLARSNANLLSSHFRGMSFFLFIN
jgi:hypothetical protein